MTCHQCGCQLVSQSAWSDATEAQRDAWRSARLAPLATRETCRNCYQRTYRRTGGCMPTKAVKRYAQSH